MQEMHCVNFGYKLYKHIKANNACSQACSLAAHAILIVSRRRKIKFILFAPIKIPQQEAKTASGFAFRDYAPIIKLEIHQLLLCRKLRAFNHKKPHNVTIRSKLEEQNMNKAAIRTIS
jgi:hypothetical protein